MVRGHLAALNQLQMWKLWLVLSEMLGACVLGLFTSCTRRLNAAHVLWYGVSSHRRVAPRSSTFDPTLIKHFTYVPSDNMSRSSDPPPQACSPDTPDQSPSSPQNNRITIKNRRKKYLDTHPAYFLSPSLELAGLFAFSHHLCLRQLGIQVD